MKKDTIVQFVCFETNATNEAFIIQWEQYTSMAGKNHEVRLQRAASTKNTSNYVSQHWCDVNDSQFVFKKGKRSAHSTEVEMRIKEAGGYIPLQLDYTGETHGKDSKVFVFVSAADSNLEVYKTFTSFKYLNIYEAYYESCTYSYILEFFVANTDAEQLMDQIKIYNRASETGIYKECLVMAK